MSKSRSPERQYLFQDQEQEAGTTDHHFYKQEQIKEAYQSWKRKINFEESPKAQVLIGYHSCMLYKYLNLIEIT